MGVLPQTAVRALGLEAGTWVPSGEKGMGGVPGVGIGRNAPVSGGRGRLPWGFLWGLLRTDRTRPSQLLALTTQEWRVLGETIFLGHNPS